MTEKEEPCWIARRPECGHIVAAVVIARRDFGVEAGREAMKWRTKGLKVEQIEMELARTGDWCKCPRKHERHRATKTAFLAAQPALKEGL